MQSYATIIPLLSYFKDETNESVWSIVALAINEIKRFVEPDEPAEQKLKNLVGDVISIQYARLGWDEIEGEDENDVKLRSTIVSLALFAELPDALREADSRFHAGSIDTLDPELRTTIMANAVRRELTDDIIDVLLAAYPKVTSSEFRDDIAAALTSTKSESVIVRLLDLLKDTSFIRTQDFVHWFVWLFRNRYGRDTTWQWARDNWDWIAKTFKGDSHYDMLPRYIAGSLINSTQLEEFKSFFGPLEAEVALARNITIGYTELEGIVTLLESDGPKVRQALLDL